ncbi:MAG: PrgI family protein [Patescibacteria group bacterium]
MSQFSVPQFTEVEDKIIGPLTLKQFIIMLIGAAVIFVFYRAIPGFFFILPSIPVAGLTLVTAFYKYNERPLEELALGAVGYLTDPKVYIFDKQAWHPTAKKKDKKKVVIEAPSVLSPEERESRLQKLTYVLEQEVKQEEEMIKGRMKRER